MLIEPHVHQPLSVIIYHECDPVSRLTCVAYIFLKLLLGIQRRVELLCLGLRIVDLNTGLGSVTHSEL
jgi:hypothetical protein